MYFIVSTKSKLILTGMFLVSFLWSCILGGKSSINLISIFIFAIGISSLIAWIIPAIGLFITSSLIGGLVSLIFDTFIGYSNEFSKFTYVMVFISDILTLTLVHFILLNYDKKLLNKTTFRKIQATDAINFILLGVGISVIVSILSVILQILIPSYTNV